MMQRPEIGHVMKCELDEVPIAGGRIGAHRVHRSQYGAAAACAAVGQKMKPPVDFRPGAFKCRSARTRTGNHRLMSHAEDAENDGKTAVFETRTAPGTAHDANLAAVVAAWAKLSVEVKASILAMVRAGQERTR